MDGFLEIALDVSLSVQDVDVPQMEAEVIYLHQEMSVDHFLVALSKVVAGVVVSLVLQLEKVGGEAVGYWNQAFPMGRDANVAVDQENLDSLPEMVWGDVGADRGRTQLARKKQMRERRLRALLK